jgi:hypothetical protein
MKPIPPSAQSRKICLNSSGTGKPGSGRPEAGSPRQATLCPGQERQLGGHAPGPLCGLCRGHHDQGLCLECVRTGAAVVSADLGADRPRWPLFASSALAGSSSNGRKASSRKGTDCPWRQRSTRCGSTPATRTSSSPTSPSPWSTIILAPGFPRARGTGRPVARAKGRDAFVTPIVPSWLVPRPGPGSAPQACAGSPGCVSSPCSR